MTAAEETKQQDVPCVITNLSHIHTPYSHENPKHVELINKMIRFSAYKSVCSYIKKNTQFIYVFHVPSETSEINCIIGITTDVISLMQKLTNIYSGNECIMKVIEITSKDTSIADSLIAVLKLKYNFLCLPSAKVSEIRSATLYKFNPVLLREIDIFMDVVQPSSNSDPLASFIKKEFKADCDKSTEALN